MITSSDIRTLFLNYFSDNGHRVFNSGSLLPDNDPTIMFTNAGMVQFKNVFMGKEEAKFKKAATVQKCLRAGGKHNDLENVGYTSRHHTFFEMLGNFSFGDYFKEEAIYYAWNFVAKELKISQDRLLVTVHSSDDEAFALWKKIAGFDDSKIIRISTNDNFWSMGNVGPCGPCTEIFFDHGDKVQGGPPGSKDADGDRFVEIWNIVFMQFETLYDGSKINLPSKSIDTGMGLERITSVLQGVTSNFETDLFKSIIAEIKKVTKNRSKECGHSNNVIADHIRAIAFLISEGVFPSNEGRGYVLRRIIRRALRHGYIIGMRKPFLYKLIPIVKNMMGSQYPELVQNEHTIASILEGEEEGFMKTIKNGMELLEIETNKLGDNVYLPADVAYKLYDTYGFPIDLTQDILRSKSKKVDISEFDKISESNREASKERWSGSGEKKVPEAILNIKGKIKESDIEFVRDVDNLKAKILFIVKNGIECKSISLGETGLIITDQSCFYPESGGQIGDSGNLKNKSGHASVKTTNKIAGIHVHHVVCEDGNLNVGDDVDLCIDPRDEISMNHTCSHILHDILKSVLGDWVVQKGSHVDRQKLRLDFVHNEVISKEQTQEIENRVNEIIDRGYEVHTNVMPLEEAIASKATTLIGGKYSDTVRVVSIGENFSKALCGGTHVSNTSQIKFFKIISLSSLAAGVKRIEAITGNSVVRYLEEKMSKLSEELDEKKILLKSMDRQVQSVKSQAAIESIHFRSKKKLGCQIMLAEVIDLEHQSILKIIDSKKEKNDKLVLIVSCKNSESGNFAVFLYVSGSLFDQVDALSSLEHVDWEMSINMKIGGKPGLAVASGIQSSQINEVISILNRHILTKIVKF